LNELYSRSLSGDARAKLIDWIEAYVVSLQSSYADARAETAKQKAIELLRDTDIDILVFVTTIVTMHSDSGRRLLGAVVHSGAPPRDIAITMVRIMEESLKRDKQARSG